MADLDQLFRFIRSLPDTMIERGLASDELDQLERQFAFRFPPDLRDLLGLGLPVGRAWPHWRASLVGSQSAAAVDIRSRLEEPLTGVLFDVESNSFLDPEWGDKPTDLVHARQIASDAVQAAPKLVPVHGHRYLPTDPCIAGNPVLSVYQADIIVYGRDLPSYFRAESGSWDAALAENARTIRCWTRWMNAEWE